MTVMSNAVIVAVDHPIRVALNAVDEALDTVREAEIWALSDDELEQAIQVSERLAARQAELGLRLLREADDRDLGRRMGGASTAGWLRHRFRMRPGTAKSRIDLAHRLPVDDATVDWSANVGSSSDKGAMPATGAALAAGEVTADHAQVIAKIMSRLPSHVDPEEAGKAEADLAKWAKTFDPGILARLGEHLLHVLDADGLADDEDEKVSKRELRINEHTGRGSFRLDKEGLALLRSALDPLAAPRPADDGTPDPRNSARRLADALVELARRACDAGDILPTSRGARPHLTLIAGLETLLAAAQSPGGDENAKHEGDMHDTTSSVPNAAPGADGVAPGELAWGGPISAAAVRRIACDAGVTRVVLDPEGVPLDVGREFRTVTPGQFTALVARDGGCAFPGCTRPAAWCEAHHIRHWADGGATSLDNLVLLCGHHHRTVHHRGWEVRLDPRRLPEFVPPPWVDPAQNVQRNTRPRYYDGGLRSP